MRRVASAVLLTCSLVSGCGHRSAVVTAQVPPTPLPQAGKLAPPSVEPASESGESGAVALRELATDLPERSRCVVAYVRGSQVRVLDLHGRTDRRITGPGCDDPVPSAVALAPTLIGATQVYLLRTDRVSGRRLGLWRARWGGEPLPRVDRVAEGDFVGIGYDRPRRRLLLLQREAPDPGTDEPLKLRLLAGPVSGPFEAVGPVLRGWDVGASRLRVSGDGSLASAPSLSGNPGSAYYLCEGWSWSPLPSIDRWPAWFSRNIDGYAFSDGRTYATACSLMAPHAGGGLYEVIPGTGPRGMLAPFEHPRGLAVSAEAGLAVVADGSWDDDASRPGRARWRSDLTAVLLADGASTPLVRGEDPDIWPG